MGETPTNPATTTPAPETPVSEGTGAAADAAPVDANPQVDHEGTGPGDLDNLPESNTDEEVEPND